ncbi:hypothetical protein T459_12465 [Capsicum annuum]|uniref:Uncharacterized protein n=1 Tax=Capsicum annuum TaxID=4072 RepID=A0A2G2ZPW6_CAPAN|nr:hypothetical protein T459_12465 [Capsicum annuum]
MKLFLYVGSTGNNILHMRLEKVKAEIDEYSKNPQAVHSAGYGNSLAATEATVNRLNNTILEEFVAENYTTLRIILAASGVEHDELLQLFIRLT